MTLASPAHRLRVEPLAPQGGPALFLDRDGTLIEERRYLADPAGVALIPGAAQTLKRFRDAGYALVLVTNQSGIGSGRFGWDDYDSVAAAVRAALLAEGLSLDAEFVCGHAADEICDWRKPAPGMIEAAAQLLGTRLGPSVLVGDKLADIEAGAKAGIGTLAHVLSGHGAAEREKVGAASLAVRPILIDSIADLAPCES